MPRFATRGEYAAALVRDQVCVSPLDWPALWFDRLVFGRRENEFKAGPYCIKRLKRAKFTDYQIFLIRDAACRAAYSAMKWIVRKHPAIEEHGYISYHQENFDVINLYLNVPPEIRADFNEKVHRLFDKKLKQIEPLLN